MDTTTKPPCGCPDTPCSDGRRLITLVRRGTMLRHQYGTTTEQSMYMRQWAEHLGADHATAITQLPVGTL